MQGEEVGSQTEEGGNLTSREEVVEEEAEVEVEVGKEEPVAGMTVMISPLILDPLVPAGMHSQQRNSLSHLNFFTVCSFSANVLCHPNLSCSSVSLCLPGFASRPGKGRGSSGGSHSGRDGGRGRGGRDHDRDGRGSGKSSGKALPRSLARTRPSPKTGDGIKPEMSSMPLQRIFMTNENQEQLKELLRNLQSQDFDEPYE